MGQAPSIQIPQLQQMQPTQQKQPTQQMQPIQQMKPMQQLKQMKPMQKIQQMQQSARRNYEGALNTLNSEKYQKLKSMGRNALDNIQNGRLVQGFNDKIQEKMNDINQKINENIQKMKTDLKNDFKKETITDIAETLQNSEIEGLPAVGDLIMKKADSIGKDQNSSTGGGKKYKSKKHNRTKKNNRTKKHNRTKNKSNKNSRTKKKRTRTRKNK